MKNIVKTICQYLAIIALVIIIRIFVVTPIEVDGRSMEDTLFDNDIMLLNIIGMKTSGINRFDIVVIKYENEYLIKRVIGLPGETVEYKDNKLYINDELTKDVVDVSTADFSTDVTLEDGIIPENKYFVLGDNRGNSADSRVIGLIDKKDIIGKTSFILFPLNHFGKVK
jgi:signal peptidase I